MLNNFNYFFFQIAGGNADGLCPAMGVWDKKSFEYFATCANSGYGEIDDDICDDCDENASCISGLKCQCNQGYQGDGKTCNIPV